MKQYLKQGFYPVIFLFFFLSAKSQAPAYNQNSARSNHPKMLSPGFDFQMTPQYGIGLKGQAADSLFFRGNGPGFKMDAGFSFGDFGIGISSGFISSQTDKSKINEFLLRAGVPTDQMLISTGNQQNMYLLLGPSAVFGKKIQAAVHAKGGMFINNGGFVNIRRQGAQGAIYRNEPSSKSIYPGFSTGININYQVSDIISIGFGTDYLSTKSEVVNYDIRRSGGAVSAEGIKLSKNISSIMSGISIRYNIKSPRDAASGQASGRQLGKPKYEDIKIRDVSTGQASGKRVLPTVNKREIAIDESGVHVYEIITLRDVATGKIYAQYNPKEIAIEKKYQPGQPQYGNKTTEENCGPVKMTKTNPDGSIEEMLFACPEDAAAYIVNSHATPGTEVSRTYVVPHVLEKGGMISRDIAARNILAGKITRSTSSSENGIITNKSASSPASERNGVATGAGAAAGAASFLKGIVANIYAREAGSGMATGRRKREAGSGMATGRRQYEPVFFDKVGTACTDCIVTVKANPLYMEKGNSGTNPLYQGNNKMTGGDDDCDGVSGLSVYLVDINTNAIVAKTQTESCGDFWFANIPPGNYSVNISGGFMSKKGYDAYLSKKADLAGEILAAEDYWTVHIITDTGSAQDARALIKTKTKSNQSNDRLVNTSRSNIKNLAAGVGDLDGDGASDIIIGSAVSNFGEKVNQGLHAAGSALSQGASLLGGSLPGGAVISYALSPGNPIGGLTIKGGKNPGGNSMSAKTNEYGEFEFAGWEEGNYTISAGIKYYINDKTIVSLGGVNNDEYNSVSQNSQTLKSSNGGMPNRISMNVTVPKQTQGATFGEKVKSTGLDTESDLATADKAVSVSRSNIKGLDATLAELEKMLDGDKGTSDARINNTKSNIKNITASLGGLERMLLKMGTMDKNTAMTEINAKMAAMNMQFLALQQSLEAAGKQYTSISNVLKTKHDTVKNSIGNIR